MTPQPEAVYFIVSMRSESTNYFRSSVPLRYAVPVFFAAFAAFAALNLTSFGILTFTPPDVIFATWTLLALRADRQARAKPAQAV